MIYDTIIIGAGAAGLFAAASLKKGTALLLEASKKPGMKLLMAGSGMCNYTHGGSVKAMADHYGDKKNFVRKALFAFDNQMTVSYFKERGIESEVDERGKVFPISRKSSDLLNALMLEASSNGVHLAAGEKAVMIGKGDDGIFRVVTELGSYCARMVLITCGGKSYPTTGSDGSGYDLASMVGHTIVPPHPTLTPVFVSNFSMVDLSGTSFDDIRIQLYRHDKKMHTFNGEMLITHKGFSGPVILDNTRWMAPGDVLSMNYLHEQFPTPESLDSLFVSEAKVNGRRHVRTLVKELGMTKRLGDALMAKAGVPQECTLAELGKELRKQLVRAVTDDRYNIGKLGGYNVAMATAGGVPTTEVNAATLESRIVSGLFFAGEVLDIDGDSGGYNIQWAFSSAHQAIEEITKRL